MKKKIFKIFIPIILSFTLIVLISSFILGFGIYHFNKFRINLLYNEFNEKYDEYAKIPGLDSTFVPQGITYCENKEITFVTGYCTDKSPSPIYLVDKNGNCIKKVSFTLYNGKDYKGHAGAIISYKDYIFVSSGNIIYTLDLNTILNAKNNAKINIQSMTSVEVSGASMFIYKDYLVVTEFYEENDYPTPDTHHINIQDNINHSLAFAYKLSDTTESGLESAKYEFVFSIPDKVQGIVYHNDKFIVSTSYGRFNDSYIYIYDENKLINDHIKYEGKLGPTDTELLIFDISKSSKKIKVLPMSEGLTIINNDVIIIFESGASKYKTTSKCSTDYIWNLKDIYK